MEGTLNGDKITVAEHLDEKTPINQEYNEMNLLKEKISTLEKGLKAVLSGDVQSLAYILYPKDFTDVNNTTLEL